MGNETNAVKAQVITAVNALMGLLMTFGVGLDDAQQGAIVLFVNAIAGLYVALTYKKSHKRIEG